MRLTLWHVFRQPLLLAVLTLVGLLSALLGEGVWDWVSWLSLGWVCAVGGFHSLRNQ
ncbi:hypothetical protein HNQ59_001713 [Chitinivorax tropicus]|uniref:Uncharacterized protein n=1 Tax=Chitinivorax tropicus TaxID=714531 RepID=A0A840MLR2_9PROT|nr:hypothetical protein [Chitinivorax tropicus]MBB5018425.1 hypothetical protein [Chitinivorax tropicus]